MRIDLPSTNWQKKPQQTQINNLMRHNKLHKPPLLFQQTLLIQPTPAATGTTSAVTAETHRTVQSKVTTDEAEIAANNIHEGWTSTEHESNFTTVSRNSDKSCLFIVNLDDSTTGQELLSLFGLDSTPDTKKLSSAEITYKCRGKYKVYAKLRTHYKFALEIIKLNGIIFNRRELLIQQKKSPHNSKQSSRRMGKNNLPYNPRNALLAGVGTEAIHPPESQTSRIGQ